MRLLCCLTLVLLAGCAAQGRASVAPAAASPVVDVSASDCGSTWQPVAGPQQVVLHNAGTAPGELRIIERAGSRPGGVLLQVEPFGPGTTVTRTVRLGAGRYSLLCLMEDAPAVVGPTVTVTGSATGGPAVVAVDPAQLAGPARAYTAWVVSRLPGLLASTRSLGSAVALHDAAGARAAWLRAHAGYVTLGAAYDAFGDLDGRITGAFGVLETGLWSHHDWPTLARASSRLTRDVAALRRQLATSPVDGLTISIRAHEITENLLQTQLTGQDDRGSHSALATIAAGLAGTREVLGLVRPLLRSRSSALPALGRALSSDQALVRRLLRTPLASRPVAAWPIRTRELVSARLSALSEQLAPVAAVLEPRRTS